MPWTALSVLLGLHLVLWVWGLGLRGKALTFPETALQLAADAALLGGLVVLAGVIVSAVGSARAKPE